jgi:hypothetical protein
MTKRVRQDRGVSIEEEEGPSPLNKETTFRSVKYAKGSVNFSELHFLPPPHTAEDSFATADGIDLQWQGLRELKADHGLFAIFDILRAEGFSGSEIEGAALAKEVKEKVSPKVWRVIQRMLSSLDDVHNRSGQGTILLTALWAEIYADPFEELWLAAMAQHAYFVEESDFAFGYLTALIDQKRNIESHFLRGKKSVESGKLGGAARSASLRARTDRTLAEIERLLHEGLSLARSAHLAHRNGYGTSPSANARLWNRHTPK